MSIFLQQVEHGKEDDRIDDKTDNHANGTRQVEKNNNGIRESICTEIGNEDAQQEGDQSLCRGSRFHTSTGRLAYKNQCRVFTAGGDRNR